MRSEQVYTCLLDSFAVWSTVETASSRLQVIPTTANVVRVKRRKSHHGRHWYLPWFSSKKGRQTRRKSSNFEHSFAARTSEQTFISCFFLRNSFKVLWKMVLPVIVMSKMVKTEKRVYRLLLPRVLIHLQPKPIMDRHQWNMHLPRWIRASHVIPLTRRRLKWASLTMICQTWSFISLNLTILKG